MTTVLQSFVAGRWIGQQPAQVLHSAINGKEVAFAHAETLDFGEALQFGRTTGLQGMLDMDFQQRAAALRALAKYLGERKEELYAISAHTGATRIDSWVDIEGGTGTLFAYAGMAASELPSGNLIHEGPVAPLGKKNTFAGTHILVPRGGVAVHINAFNFPVWGLLEKFAPTFLAGMPCIGKPATATSYLTEALVRMIDQSGILPKGALQLVIGSTGDLLDRLDVADVVTFTGSADTAAKLRVNANVVRNSIPFNAEADSLNCAILADDVTPDDEEFDLFVKEVVREMTVKAGQKCTAIRRAIDQAKHPALFVVDVVASLGAIPFYMDQWGVNAVIGASQKGLMCPPGVGFCAADQRAMQVCANNPAPRFYWDWMRRRKGPSYSRFCGTAPQNLLFGLEAAFGLIEQEGVTQVHARHQRLAGAVHAAVQAWSEAGQVQFLCQVPEARSASVTAVLVSQGIDPELIRSTAREKYQVLIAGGLGPFAGRVFRIGHLGDLNPAMIDRKSVV